MYYSMRSAQLYNCNVFSILSRNQLCYLGSKFSSTLVVSVLIFKSAGWVWNPFRLLRVPTVWWQHGVRTGRGPSLCHAPHPAISPHAARQGLGASPGAGLQVLLCFAPKPSFGQSSTFLLFSLDFAPMSSLLLCCHLSGKADLSFQEKSLSLVV